MLWLKNKITTLKRSRVWKAQDAYNTALQDYNNILKQPVKTSYWMTTFWKARAYEISNEDNARFDSAVNKMNDTKRALNIEKKRHKEYRKAKANWRRTWMRA